MTNNIAKARNQPQYPDRPLVRLGAGFRDARRSQYITQAEIARKLGISQQAISRFESTGRSSIAFLLSYSKAIGVPASQIIESAGL